VIVDPTDKVKAGDTVYAASFAVRDGVEVVSVEKALVARTGPRFVDLKSRGCDAVWFGMEAYAGRKRLRRHELLCSEGRAIHDLLWRASAELLDLQVELGRARLAALRLPSNEAEDNMKELEAYLGVQRRKVDLAWAKLADIGYVLPDPERGAALRGQS